MELITSWEKKGRKEGRKEGRQEGQKQEKIQIAKNMLEGKKFCSNMESAPMFSFPGLKKC